MSSNTGLLTLDNIRVVKQVLLKRSLTQAATDLNMTQPAVSFHVKKFEKTVSRRIVRRVGNELRVSDDGLKLLDIFERMYYLQSKIELLFEESWEKRMTLGICPDFFFKLVNNGGIGWLIHQYKIVLDQPKKLIDRYGRGELDLLFCPICSNGKNDLEFVVDVPFRWVGTVLDGGDFQNTSIPVILEEKGTPYSTIARNYLMQRDLEYSVVAEANSLESLTSLINSGIGFAVMPKFSIDRLKLLNENLIEPLRDEIVGRFALFHRDKDTKASEVSHLFETFAGAIG